MEILVYVYILTDAKGNKKADVATDPSDNICVGGDDKDGKYHQFDSTEAYHLESWATKHGFLVEVHKKTISV